MSFSKYQGPEGGEPTSLVTIIHLVMTMSKEIGSDILVLRPVSEKTGSSVLRGIQVSRGGCGRPEKIPTMVRSSPRVARTTAGLSFAALRSVKGNLTRTTSPG